MFTHRAQAPNVPIGCAGEIRRKAVEVGGRSVTCDRDFSASSHQLPTSHPPTPPYRSLPTMSRKRKHNESEAPPAPEEEDELEEEGEVDPGAGGRAARLKLEAKRKRKREHMQRKRAR